MTTDVSIHCFQRVGDSAMTCSNVSTWSCSVHVAGAVHRFLRLAKSVHVIIMFLLSWSERNKSPPRKVVIIRSISMGSWVNVLVFALFVFILFGGSAGINCRYMLDA